MIIESSGIQVPVVFLLRGHSTILDDTIAKASGKSNLEILLGKKFQTTVIIYSQLFIVIEFVIYIILFMDAYNHNQELMCGKFLGISQDSLRKRKKKSVITLFGQFLCFFIEITTSIMFHAVQIDFPPVMITSGFHTAAIILSSPELMRFYFKGA